MNVFIQAIIFNPDLLRQAVRISGETTEGDKMDRVYIVQASDGDSVKLIDYSGKVTQLYKDEFKPGFLSMTILGG